MKELMGGLWFTGLLAWALLGFIPGLICIILGALAGSWELVRELQAVKTEKSWRKNYPSYKY